MKLPAIDPANIEPRRGSGYPEKFRAVCAKREKRILGDPCGLTQFGVNLTTIPPGGWSSQRHWHTHEDEFVFVVEGELVLVTDTGEQVLKVGTGAGFPANSGDGHQLINRTDKPAVYLEIGTRDARDEAEYSDIDMKVVRQPRKFVTKSGAPY
jgi:uncharacterized cupin superfamily protein